MASQTEIANRALTKIGAARILALDDEVEQARVITACWDVVRDAELRSHSWNFAIRRASLAALVDTPTWGYAYQYQLPSGCLRLLQAGEYFPGPSMSDYRGSNEAMWAIEGGKILTDLSAPLKIRYVYSVTTVGDWDSLFAEAFACRLAVEICEPITQSTQKRELAWKEYKTAIREAKKADAIENPSEPLADDTWILARL